MVVMDADDKERWRLEGYLPKDDFRTFLEMGLARVAFIKKDWADAERRYTAVIDNQPDSYYAPQAVYYRGVSRYSATHDAAELAKTGKVLTEQYPGNEWQLRSIPWLHEKSETTTG